MAKPWTEITAPNHTNGREREQMEKNYDLVTARNLETENTENARIHTEKTFWRNVDSNTLRSTN